MVVNQWVSLKREASPSLLAIDSQSVKTVQFVSEATGADGGKKTNECKRTILLDTLGLPLAVKLENDAGLLALETLKGKVPKLKKTTADAGYKDAFVEGVKAIGWPV